MNKQIISMTAVAAMAGAALAVESKNVVGFKNMASASFQLITPMFTQVGGGTSFTLADFVPEDIDAWDPAANKILLYTGANKDYEATYLNADIVADIIENFPSLAGITAGWFDYDDFSALGSDENNIVLKCYSNRPINFSTSGFAILSGNAIRFKGEVSPADATPQSATFQLVGNCTPVDLTLAQIVPADTDEWDPAADKLLFYTGANKDYEATYLNADIVADIIENFPSLAGITAGWFDYDDFSALGSDENNIVLKCYNSRAIPAGTGFAIQSKTAIKIPAPQL